MPSFNQGINFLLACFSPNFCELKESSIRLFFVRSCATYCGVEGTLMASYMQDVMGVCLRKNCDLVLAPAFRERGTSFPSTNVFLEAGIASLHNFWLTSKYELCVRVLIVLLGDFTSQLKVHKANWNILAVPDSGTQEGTRRAQLNIDRCLANLTIFAFRHFNRRSKTLFVMEEWEFYRRHNSVCIFATHYSGAGVSKWAVKRIVQSLKKFHRLFQMLKMYVIFSLKGLQCKSKYKLRNYILRSQPFHSSDVLRSLSVR